MVFVEEEVDKRGKLYKAVKSKGYIAELSTQDAGTLKRWVAGLVRKEQKQISESVIVYFLDKVGTDMENIQGRAGEGILLCTGERYDHEGRY